MDRDKVIGLAMAILLIGVVAAFSFRRQPDPVEQVPELHDPALADRGFEDRVVTPYVTGIEPIESTAVAHHNAPTVKSPRSPVVDNVWNEPLPDFLDKKLQSDVPVPKVPSEVAPAVTRLKAETKEGTIPIVE